MNFVQENISIRRTRTLIWLLVLPLVFIILFVIVGIYYVTGMPGHSYSGTLSPLTEDQIEISNRLKRHVETLAGYIGERNTIRYEELKQSASYIEEILMNLGYRVYVQNFETDNRVVRNVEVEITGRTRPEEIIVIGAHYDSACGTPGADDNATGTAAVLELARLLKGQSLERTVRFVLFVNEELPFFGTEYMGSWVHARRSKYLGEKIAGMLSIEMAGYYSDVEGSQKYPFPFSYFYPKTGNFIAFVGNLPSRSLVRKCVASFRKHAAFPSEGAAAPGQITGIGWSDHWAFWQEGYQAIMITDTAFFRYKYYHTSEDTPDKIDYPNMARVVSGLRYVIVDLANDE